MKRVYMDLDINIVAKAKEKAYQLRIPLKRYVEALIEKDCASIKLPSQPAQSKKGK